MTSDHARDAQPSRAGNDSDLDIELHDVETGGQAVDAAKAPVHIRLDAAVRQQMIEYALTNTSCELGGMLIGTVKDGSPPVVAVEAMIPARYTDAVHASITFTHATWQDIHAVKDRMYPQKKIIGWFHTHPGFGIFLSSYDMHIHRNFFNIDWQIAYVVDPRAGTEGFFRWEHGAVQKTSDYEIFGATTAPLPLPIPPPVRVPSQWAEPRNYLIALLLLLAVGMGVYHNMHPRLVYREIVVTPPPDIISPPLTPRTAPPLPPGPARRHYTVQSNDSLWLISRRCYGDDDVARGMAVIKAANRLSSDTIYPGMRLWVPDARISGNEEAADAVR